MAHSLVQKVLIKCLRIIGGKRRDHRNDHLADNEVSVGFEVEDLFCCIKKGFLHELVPQSARANSSQVVQIYVPCLREVTVLGR